MKTINSICIVIIGLITCIPIAIIFTVYDVLNHTQLPEYENKN